MVSWNIIRSTEEMFHLWAVKHLCKFVLKKKLGEFIAGDVDLDQLEVQLLAGAVHLSKIGLNIDFLNKKLGPSKVAVKEGFVGSLLINLPWNSKKLLLESRHFQVEVGELEIILAPCEHDVSTDATCRSDEAIEHHATEDLKKQEVGGRSVAVAVHEGVKKVARIVQRLLTNFSVKIRDLIIAFDPSTEKVVRSNIDEIIVLRIREFEYITCFSEGHTKAGSTSEAHGFFDTDGLTSVMTLQGVQIEFLCNEESSSVSVPFIKGQTEGFFASVKLNIPWKNGSLNLQAVEADIVVDPLELRLQPTTISWILQRWNYLKVVGQVGKSTVHCKGATSSSATHCCTSNNPSMTVNEVMRRDKMHPPDPFPACQRTTNTSQQGAHVIFDWVPLFGDQSGLKDESNHVASVEQFFECYDEMRKSQAAPTSSSIWDWPCSFLTAITAASSLASGSVDLAPDHRNVSAIVKAKVGEITSLLYFCDELQIRHGLRAKCVDLSLCVEIRPRDMKVEGLLKHFVLEDYCSSAANAGNHCFFCGDYLYMHAPVVKNLQDELQSVLPPPSFPAHNFDMSEIINDSGNEETDVVSLLRFQNDSGCHISLSFTFLDESSTLCTSLSIHLPPLICWISLYLIDALSRMFSEVKDCIASVTDDRPGFFYQGDIDGTKIQRNCNNAMVNVTISLSTARFFICFPIKRECPRMNPIYIVVDLSSSLVPSRIAPDFSPVKGASDMPSCSANLDFEDINCYLITSIDTHDDKFSFSSSKILSVASNGHRCCVDFCWREGLVTGSWIADKAWSLATTTIQNHTSKIISEGYDFTSVAMMDGLHPAESYLHQEMILCSVLFLHVRCSVISINLDTSNYQRLCHLFEQFTVHSSGFANDREAHSDGYLDEDVSRLCETCSVQSSLLVELGEVHLSIDLDVGRNAISFSEMELPGTWAQLRLFLEKVELLTVVNIGGIGNAMFNWLSHGASEIWGSIKEITEEFLLINFSSQVAHRGNGEGSNALISENAGIVIVCMSNPELLQNSVSLTISCMTVICPGGRLDWVFSVCSFFNLFHTEETSFNLNKEVPKVSFFIEVTDAALSYDPYNQMDRRFAERELDSKPYVAGMLACAQFSIQSKEASLYKIKLHDIGFLISSSIGNRKSSIYSVKCLHEGGYVKVASGTLMEATLRTSNIHDEPWELEFVDSHITFDTCHDTTAALVRLFMCIQELFAPDIEESVVHLQRRSDTMQNAHKNHDSIDDLISHHRGKSVLLRASSPMMPSNADQSVNEQGHQNQNGSFRWSNICRTIDDTTQFISSTSTFSCGMSPDSTASVHGLMDEIVDDAFCLDTDFVRHTSCPFANDSPNSHHFEYACDSSSRGKIPVNIFLADLIETYCTSEPSCVNDVHNSAQCLNIELGHKTQFPAFSGVTDGQSNGWYEDSLLNIVDNHISSTLSSLEKPHQSKFLSFFPDSSLQPRGRIILRNASVQWRMYDGADWACSRKKHQSLKSACRRNKTVCLELILSGIDLHYNLFHVVDRYVSSTCLSVLDICLHDESKGAPWKKILRSRDGKNHPTMTGGKAFRLGLEVVRPDPCTPLEEYRLYVAFSPLWLRLHQLQLDFMITFFSFEDLSSGGLSKFAESCTYATGNIAGSPNMPREALLPFFQIFDIWPLHIHVDYIPDRVNISELCGGNYAELINLLCWKGIDLQLKHVHAVGLHGWNSICETVMASWLDDVLHNQIHKIMGGLVPIRSLLSVGSCAAKLVLVPLQSYGKDQKLLKGLQRGATTFLKSISVETVGLGMHLVGGIHDILLKMDCLLSSYGCSPHLYALSAGLASGQPRNAHEGVQQACECLRDGLGKTASALLGNPVKIYQQRGDTGSAVAGAVRAAPTASVVPVAAAACAIHCTLAGVRNSLKREMERE